MNIEGSTKNVCRVPHSAGIYQVKNHANGRKFINISNNLPVTYNRLNFLLKIGVYDNKELQKEFNTYGESNFYFEVLDFVDLEDDVDFSEKRGELLSNWQIQHNTQVNS